MDALLHSPFLQALGWAIINSFWQYALLWLLYICVNTICNLSSNQKYNFGLLLVFAGFFSFIGTLIFYYNHNFQSTPYFYSVQTSLLLKAGISTNLNTLRQIINISYGVQLLPFLSAGYLVILFFLIARWMVSYRYIKKVRIIGLRDINDQWKAFVDNLSLQLGIKNSVQIFLSELAQTPLTVGHFKPIILIPLATINYLNEQQMEAVILHELAHIKRYDYFFNLLLALTEACLFFNPFMRLIQSQIKKERENSCDDWVIKYQYNPFSYAKALFQIASFQTHSPFLALKATDCKQLLINRIRRIIDNKEKSFFNYKHQLSALTIIAVILTSLLLLSTVKKIKPTLFASENTNHFIKSDAIKVKSLLVAPANSLAYPALVTTKKNSQPEIIQQTFPVSGSNRSSEGANEIIQDQNNLEISPPSPSASNFAANAVTINNILTAHFDEVDNFQNSSENALRQKELTEENFERFQHHYNLKNNDFFNNEKTGAQLKNALMQIRNLKKQEDLNKLQRLVNIEIKKIQMDRINMIDPALQVLKLSELALLENQIESIFNSLQSSKIFTTISNAHANINAELPKIIHSIIPTEEKEHSYSYEFLSHPKVRIISRKNTKEPIKVNSIKDEISVLINDETAIQKDEIVPPPAPKAFKFRAVYTIRI